MAGEISEWGFGQRGRNFDMDPWRGVSGGDDPGDFLDLIGWNMPFIGGKWQPHDTPGNPLSPPPAAPGMIDRNARNQEDIARYNASGERERRMMERLQQWAEEMNEPLDLNDPQIQHILNSARGGAMDAAKRRGIQGPLGVRSGEQAYVAASAPLMHARKGQALQAMSQASQIGNQLAGRDMWQQNFDYQKAQDRYQNDLDMFDWQNKQKQGGWGMVGGALGGLLGLGGGAAGVGLGWDVGSNVFGGLASLGQPKPPKFGGGSGY